MTSTRFLRWELRFVRIAFANTHRITTLLFMTRSSFFMTLSRRESQLLPQQSHAYANGVWCTWYIVSWRHNALAHVHDENILDFTIILSYLLKFVVMLTLLEKSSNLKYYKDILISKCTISIAINFQL